MFCGQKIVAFGAKTLRAKALPLFFARGLIVGFQFVSMLLLASIMDRTEYGFFVFSWSAASLLSSIVSVGGPIFLFREFSARQVDRSAGVSTWVVVKIVVIFPSVVAMIIWCLIWKFSALFQMSLMITHIVENSVLIICVALLLNFFTNIANPFWVLSGPGAAMFFRDAYPQLILVLAGGSLYFVDSVSSTNLLAVFSLFSFLGLLAAILYFLRIFGLAAVVGKSGRSFKFKSLLLLWGYGILNNLYSYIDILLGGVFLTAAELGNYQILKRLANFTFFPQMVANVSVAVGIAKCFQGKDKNELQLKCKSWHRIVLIPTIIVLLLLLLGKPILFGLYGLTAEHDLLFYLLLAAGISVAVFGPGVLVASYWYMERYTIVARVIGIIVSVMIILVFNAKLGSTGLAGAMLLSVAIMSATMSGLLLVKLKIDVAVTCLFNMCKSHRGGLM